MANITYLLGAGASANCLPTYLNFFQRFEKFKTIFCDTNPPENLSESQKKDYTNIKYIVVKIADEFKFHTTPDTIAKKHYHSSPGSDLQDLKRILILFFLFEQTQDITSSPEIPPGDFKFKQPIDKRYDSFIAALLKPRKGEVQFYNQFKVLTWNYDLQFEIAFSRYKQAYVSACQRSIQSIPTLFPDGSEEFNLDKFSIVHLNGIAYGKADSFRGNTDLIGSFSNNQSQLIEYLTDVYHSICTHGLNQQVGGDKYLTFAWEKENEEGFIVNDKILDSAYKIAEQTQVLVIIGYSFPIFNSSIDKLIFTKMNQLRKVYIQSPNGEEIKAIIADDLLNHPKLKRDNIINTNYWSQFHIPIEWNRHWNKDDSNFM